MSKGKAFIQWDDKQLEQYTLKLVADGEKFEGQAPTSVLAGTDREIATETTITRLYTKCLVIQLQRLNNKIDELLEKEH